MLSNAVKYSDQGVITVRAEQNEEATTLHVQDQGCGISQDDMDRLFKRYHQVGDMSDSKIGQGTGLGLALCYELTTAMGGQVSCESEPGHGSVFTVSFPRACLWTASADLAP